MIDKMQLMEVIHQALEGSEKYLVDLKITTDNRIYVSIDGDNGIIIDDCIELSRAIENSLNRDEEDFELNVASAGLDSPLKMTRQYIKNIGRDLSVTTLSGEKFEGELKEADTDHILLCVKGKKKSENKEVTLTYSEIKAAKVMVKF